MGVTFFAMTEKGFRTLSHIIPLLPQGFINQVITASDTNLQKDFFSEILELCKNNNITVKERKDSIHITSNYAIAIAWRWLINLPEQTQLIVLHDSILPKYRGFNPLVSALINGEKEIGVTALFANVEYDKGAIIDQDSTQINYPIKIQTAIVQIIHIYQNLVFRICNKILSGEEIPSTAQKEENATYSLWRDSNDYSINWDQSSNKIKRFIDAVGYPYDGAHSTIDNQKIKIVEVEEVTDVVIENRTPGKVIFIERGKPVVVCGEGLLRIEKILDQNNVEYHLPKFRVRFE